MFLAGSARSAEAVITGAATARDGVDIHYEAMGSGSPTLLFIHGWNCDRRYWAGQLAYFAEKHQVVAIDLAGHGESGLQRTEWTISQFGADVASVADQLVLDDVILVGHSMGGPVALEGARQLEGRVKMIIGADTLNDVSITFPEEQLKGMLVAMKTDFRGTVEGLVRGSFFLADSDPDLIDRIATDMGSAPPKAGIGAFKAYAEWFNHEAADALADIEVPIYLINSDYRPTNIEAGQALTGSFDAVLMSGVGHFVMQEDPERFNQLLNQLISSRE
ncbi:MAG: alpha/beta hydrolase [Pseudomonadota bacterium]|nr:alpha/beta hydrolase [Pseudomonadota bacterium]